MAILALFKNKSDVAEIEEMKLKMIQHEKWEISSYLPPGWLFKVIWEGWSKDKKFQQSVHYLSSEGLPFESMKSAMEYMSSSNRYNEQNITKCKEFLRSLASHPRYTLILQKNKFQGRQENYVRNWTVKSLGWRVD